MTDTHTYQKMHSSMQKQMELTTIPNREPNDNDVNEFCECDTKPKDEDNVHIVNNCCCCKINKDPPSYECCCTNSWPCYHREHRCCCIRKKEECCNCLCIMDMVEDTYYCSACQSKFYSKVKGKEEEEEKKTCPQCKLTDLKMQNVHKKKFTKDHSFLLAFSFLFSPLIWLWIPALAQHNWLVIIMASLNIIFCFFGICVIWKSNKLDYSSPFGLTVAVYVTETFVILLVLNLTLLIIVFSITYSPDDYGNIIHLCRPNILYDEGKVSLSCLLYLDIVVKLMVVLAASIIMNIATARTVNPELLKTLEEEGKYQEEMRQILVKYGVVKNSCQKCKKQKKLQSYYRASDPYSYNFSYKVSDDISDGDGTDDDSTDGEDNEKEADDNDDNDDKEQEEEEKKEEQDDGDGDDDDKDDGDGDGDGDNDKEQEEEEEEKKKEEQQSKAVNIIKDMTDKLQRYYNSLSIDLSSESWQKKIAETMTQAKKEKQEEKEIEKEIQKKIQKQIQKENKKKIQTKIKTIADNFKTLITLPISNNVGFFYKLVWMCLYAMKWNVTCIIDIFLTLLVYAFAVVLANVSWLTHYDDWTHFNLSDEKVDYYGLGEQRWIPYFLYLLPASWACFYYVVMLCSTLYNVSGIYHKCYIAMKLLSEFIEEEKDLADILLEAWWDIRIYVLQNVIPIFYDIASPIVAWLVLVILVGTLFIMYTFIFECDGDIGICWGKVLGKNIAFVVFWGYIMLLVATMLILKWVIKPFRETQVHINLLLRRISELQATYNNQFIQGKREEAQKTKKRIGLCKYYVSVMKAENNSPTVFGVILDDKKLLLIRGYIGSASMIFIAFVFKDTIKHYREELGV